MKDYMKMDFISAKQTMKIVLPRLDVLPLIQYMLIAFKQ